MFKKSFSLLKCNFRRLSSLGKPDGLAWMKNKQMVIEPMEYIKKAPCKHYAMITPGFNHWLQIPTDKYKIIEQVANNLVAAEIIQDDISDDATIRYGVPVTHSVISMGRTLNATTLGLLLEINQTMDLGHPLAPRIVLEKLIGLHYGFGISLYWRDHCLCPSEAEYLDMIKHYIGSCIFMPLELLQLFSENKTDFAELGTNITFFYRIVDDYYNLFYPETLATIMNVKDGLVNHTQNCDIKDGSFNVAIIHAMQFPDISSELTYILKKQTSDPELQKHFVKLLRKHGSDKYVREMLRKLDADIRAEIDRLGGNPILTHFMDDLGPRRQETTREVNN